MENHKENIVFTEEALAKMDRATLESCLEELSPEIKDEILARFDEVQKQQKEKENEPKNEKEKEDKTEKQNNNTENQNGDVVNHHSEANKTIASYFQDSKENLSTVSDIKPVLLKLQQTGEKIEMGDINEPETLAKIEAAAKEMRIHVEGLEDKKLEFENRGMIERYNEASSNYKAPPSSEIKNNPNEDPVKKQDNLLPDATPAKGDGIKKVLDGIEKIDASDRSIDKAANKLDALVKIGKMKPEEFEEYKKSDEFKKLHLNKKEKEMFTALNTLSNNKEFEKKNDKARAILLGRIVGSYTRYLNDKGSSKEAKRNFVRSGINEYGIKPSMRGRR